MTKSVQAKQVDPQAIRAELEETRVAFHALLATIPDDAFEQATRNPAWNVRQMLYHIVMAVEMLPQDIKLIRKGRLISPPAWLFNRVNVYVTRWRARNHTRESLAIAYDKAHAAVLAIMDDMQAGEWSLTGKYPAVGGELTGGERSIAMMYHYLSQHFQEHLPEFDRWRTGGQNGHE
ncbi:MAG: DinB family protein [Chloroflexota bacterium]|jgi:hypothetical protein